ncbi:TPA: helix-turn-helix transcriptional regulator [Burkholderia vietnamiensis]|nr:helix-turn-helix transcriptional regulator [Burkholderia vietnamiensis]
MDMTAPPDNPRNCSGVSEIFNQIGEKWTMQVVVALCDQPRRFNEIKRIVSGISQQMLTRTLKTLERDGMVERSVHVSRPPQVDYALTELGRSLADSVHQLAEWASAHRAAIHDNRLRYDEQQ